MASYPLHVRKGTERKIYVAINLSGEVCFSFKDVNDSPARVRLRRLSNRRGKDLDINTGERCLKLKGFSYEVFARALDDDVWVDVTRENVKVGPAISGAPGSSKSLKSLATVMKKIGTDWSRNVNR